MRKGVISVLVIILLLCLVTDASLILFYGKIETVANINQSILLDGIGNNIITETFNSCNGCTVVRNHTIQNRGCDDVCILVETISNEQGIVISLVGIDNEWFVIKSNETIDFSICYDFGVSLESGTYVMNVEFLPYDGCIEVYSQGGMLHGSFSFRNDCSWRYVDGWDY